jgi:hypothetical protein
MVKINIGDNHYKLPSTWSEVDLSKIVDCSTPKEQLSVLGNIPPKVLNQLTDTQILVLYQIIEYITDPESLNGILLDLPCSTIYQGDEGPMIEFSSWEKLDKARKVIDPQYHKTYFNLVKIYFPNEKSTINILSLGYKLLDQMNTFLASFQDMFEDAPEADEIEAGVEELSMFGIFATADRLSGGDLLKMDQVLSMPASVIYTKLYLDWKLSKYQENLMKIREDKRKR